eukprot:135584_1
MVNICKGAVAICIAYVCNIYLMISTDLQYMSFWEYDPYAFAGWTNFAVSSSLEEIAIGYSFGINHLYNVEHVFFETVANITCKGTNPLVLKPNYTEEWNNLLPTLNELYYVNKSIFGFFLGDELISHGTTNMPQNINTVAMTVRHSFNDSIIYTNGGHRPVVRGYNECGNYTWNKLSEYLDWFSIDLYHFDGVVNVTWVDYVQWYYQQYVFPKMCFPLVVPGAFGSLYNNQSTLSEEDEADNEDAINFYFWALNDSRIIGIYPWHWNSSYPNKPPTKPCEIGTQNLTLTQSTYKQIGEAIIKKQIYNP